MSSAPMANADVLNRKSVLTIRSPEFGYRRWMPGGAYRVVPLFPELRLHLEEAFELTEPGAKYVIARYRGDNQNLRTQFERILRRAGVRAWERLFHNLRGSRETELIDKFSLHVVCA